MTLCGLQHVQIIIMIIIKRISRAPIYHIRWEHRALYNNTNHTHTHTHTHSYFRSCVRVEVAVLSCPS